MSTPLMLRQPSGSTGSRNLLPSEDALKSPKPTHLFLNRPGMGNGSSTSVNDMGTGTPHTPHTPHTPGGIRAQLGHLLPRHTYFRAKITIHQISSVPFVSGEFGVRWKFKGVQTAPGPKQGLLGRVKARAERTASKGKTREDIGDLNSAAPSEDGHATVMVTSPGGGQRPVGERSSTSTSVASSMSSHSHISAISTATAGSSTTSVITMVATPSSTPDLSELIPASTTPGRGMTPFVKLKDHSAVWSQTLDTVLKFDVDRETSGIMPNPLKLVVMQRVIPDDPHGSPQNPRLGAVYLNLAEYVGQGSVERRYLLKESKTNATLKLTIEMEYLSGETTYIPPPLAKGEILNGIAGFLEKEIVKKRPRALDIYGPYKNQEELEIDLMGGPKSAQVPRTAKSERKASHSTVITESEDEDEEESFEQPKQDLNIAFDLQRLPVAYGTKTTEMLIEALFNPMKVAHKEQETPFTKYEPRSRPSAGAGLTPRADQQQRGVVGLGIRDPEATIGRRQGSMTQEEASSVYSTSSSSASVHTTTSSSSHSKSNSQAQSLANSLHESAVGSRSTPEGRVVVERDHGHAGRGAEDSAIGAGGMRGWWRRNVSRPGTPTTTRTQA